MIGGAHDSEYSHPVFGREQQAGNNDSAEKLIVCRADRGEKAMFVSGYGRPFPYMPARQAQTCERMTIHAV